MLLPPPNAAFTWSTVISAAASFALAATFAYSGGSASIDW